MNESRSQDNELTTISNEPFRLLISFSRQMELGGSMLAGSKGAIVLMRLLNLRLICSRCLPPCTILNGLFFNPGFSVSTSQDIASLVIL